MLIGALEAGGTKMVCALGKEDGTIMEQISIPTTTPEETIPKITAYFKDKGIDVYKRQVKGKAEVLEYHFKGNRGKIREQSMMKALDLVRRCVLKAD